MRVKPEITAEYLRSILDYNPETGVFIWKERPSEHFVSAAAMKTWNARFSGKIAGSDHAGYQVIVINQIMHRAHKLAWLYTKGYFPAMDLDHINCIKADNRMANLREATLMQNARNKPKFKNTSSSLKGVYWCKNVSKWRAKICVNKNEKHLGLFDNEEDAHTAYKDAAEIYHGEFRRVA